MVKNQCKEGAYVFGEVRWKPKDKRIAKKLNPTNGNSQDGMGGGYRSCARCSLTVKERKS